MNSQKEILLNVYNRLLNLTQQSTETTVYVSKLLNEHEELVANLSKSIDFSKIRTQYSNIADSKLNNFNTLKNQSTIKNNEGDDSLIKRKFGTGSYILYTHQNKKSVYKIYRGTIIVHGERKVIYAKTQKEMNAKLDEIYKKGLKKSNDFVSKKSTLETWNNKFFADYKKLTLAPRTATVYDSQFKKINSQIGKLDITKLTSDDIQLFINSQPAGSRKKYFDLINSSLERARKSHLIKSNPCEDLDRPTYCSKEFRCYEFFEQNEMIDKLPAPYNDVFIFLCCTGLRISEYLGLTPEDIKPNYILINKIKDSSSGKIIEKTKNGESRKIIYAPVLKKYFHLEILGTISYSVINRIFYSAYKVYKNVNLHGTRHTYASVAHFVGIDDKIIQNQLGHKTLKMTQDTYTNLMLNGKSIILNYFTTLKSTLKKIF